MGILRYIPFIGPRLAGGAGSSVAVIMVGGPTKGTRFRPLGLNCHKPLFPVAGEAMAYHPIAACAKVPGLRKVFVIGYYEEREMKSFVAKCSKELRLPVEYLREPSPKGSAGALYQHKDAILRTGVDTMFVVNCDVCCSFPLADLGRALRKSGGWGAVLGKRVSKTKAAKCGVMVVGESSQELLHYTEKPETFVSDMVNTGVYCFRPSKLFAAVEAVVEGRKAEKGQGMKRVSSFDKLRSEVGAPRRAIGVAEDFVRLDQDILTPEAGKGELFVLETRDFWEQLKEPGAVLQGSELYLALARIQSPKVLSSSKAGGAEIVGNVVVHPTARIHPTAKVGPNVTVGRNVKIGAGVRLSDCMVLDDSVVGANSVVVNAIVGWQCSVGSWVRVQGSGSPEEKLGITILGEDVEVADEVVISKCIVLPHKGISASLHGEVIL